MAAAGESFIASGKRNRLELQPKKHLPRRRGDAEKSKDKTLKHRGMEEAEEKEFYRS
jgi:hypothetical protein